MPSAFVRISGCNLRCRWCDTPYASWRPEGPVVPVGEIAERVVDMDIRHVVVTGGEPMLFDAVEPLCHKLQAAGLHITIETAGTIYRDLPCDLMSISPKLANSTPEGSWAKQHDRLRTQPDVLRKLISTFDYQLKFVVAEPEDLAEIEVLTGSMNADRGKVILMPEGVDAAVLRERGAWLAEICKQSGFRFSPRLHVELYGNRRGT
jgi:7-carboxy-7-deazaguanine synthase